jgi:hypothetical protein
VSAPLVQVIDPSMLIFLVPSGNTTGPVTATTVYGSGASSTEFGVIPSGLTLTGMWPGSTKAGGFVFVFGSAYQTIGTTVRINGMLAPLSQVVDPNLLIFMVPPGAATGKVTVNTSNPSASVTSAADLIVLP